MKKKIWSILFLFIAMLGGTLHVQAAQLKQVPSGYIGIYTVSDLDSIRNNLKGNYILMADIDMSEETRKGGTWDTGNGWNPIKDFAGVFDGNGHRIIGMNIYGYAGQGVGLFGNTLMQKGKGVVVKNLGMVDVSIDVNFSGRSQYDSMYDGYIGSIVGYVDASSDEPGKTKIENCYVTGNIQTQETTPCVGGLIGLAAKSWWVEVKNCYNNVNIDGGYHTGGILGGCGEIGNCYNTGNVVNQVETTNYVWAGGLVGYGNFLRGTESYYLYGSAREATGSKDNNRYKYYDCLTETQMRMQNSYVGWDFENIWYIDPYCSYPYPQLVDCPAIRVESVELVQEPLKTVYQMGDAINLDGAQLRITYEDGVSALVSLSSKMLSGYDMNIIGTQTVMVTYGGMNTSFDIDVKEVPVQSISIDASVTSLYRGKTLQLQAFVLPSNASHPVITWTSDNEAVATVDARGVVMAKSGGRVTIFASSSNGITAKIELTVLIRGVSIQLNKSRVDLCVGDMLDLLATITPLDATDKIFWQSSDTNVVDVIDGTIYANHTGSAIVTAYTEWGVSAKCNVNVKKIDRNSTSDNKIIKMPRARIKSVKNKAGNKIIVVVASNKKAKKYDIQYSTNKRFKNNRRKQKVSSSVTLKKLKKGKKYYIRARLVYEQNGKNIYGRWSKVKAVKVKR